MVTPQYPTALPTTNQCPTNLTDFVSDVLVSQQNPPHAEILAIAKELGTLPKGAYADVKARLDSLAGISFYDTGWINRSDWTNVHLGSDDTKNVDSNVNHNLNAPLSDLLIKVFVSTDGTDANSFEISFGINIFTNNTEVTGITVSYIDANNIKVQTAANGIMDIPDDGSGHVIDIEDWYYKIKVYKLT